MWSGSSTKTLRLRKKKKFVTVARRKGCCDRIAGTSDYRMGETHAALVRGLMKRGDDWILTLDPAFQGLPETAHGGTVLAAFHLASGAESAAVRGLYRRRVPVGAPLRLALARDGDRVTCLLTDDAGALVDGSVKLPGASRSGRDDSVTLSVDDGYPVPISRSCFACGTDNALGLHAQLRHDETVVGGTWRPETSHEVAGMVAPVALTTLLDETAFWLGVLASGESGMTTDLDVTLLRPVPFGASIIVGGRRGDVKARADDRRYWDTHVAVWDDAGQRVAEATITFVAVRGAARRLVTGMLAMNPPSVVRRVFPTHTR